MKSLIAVTDVETTGLWPRFHEIIEVGMVLMDAKTLEVKDELDLKVMPTELHKASREALNVNGFNLDDWKEAVPLNIAMKAYLDKAANATFAAHNMIFDWDFIDFAFYKTGLKNIMDYHKIDLFSVAWTKLRHKLTSYSLKNICLTLGIEPEPEPHRAINGARCEYQVLKKLMEMS